MKEWISGRNPVYECLRAGRRQFFRLLMAEGTQESGRVQEILVQAARRKLTVERTAKNTLSGFSENHQGLALQVGGFPYSQLDDIFKRAKDLSEALFILILDQIQDPQNLGALVRSAEVFGVHGILIPSSRSAGITPAVVQSSSGACEHMLIAQGNLAQAIDTIKANDGWVIGLDMDTQSVPLAQVDLAGSLAIVVGSEGGGLRRLVREKCDLIAHIPMRGKLDSLNAAAAGSIALYCAAMQR